MSVESFNFEEFGAKVPSSVKGAIEKSILASPPDYVGAQCVSETSEDTNDYYVVGLTQDDFGSVGINSINDISLLHSMSQNDSVFTIFLENSSYVLGFLFTQNLKTIIETNPSLKKLSELNWGVYKIINPESESPELGKLAPLVVSDAFVELPFAYISTFFESATTRSLTYAVKDLNNNLLNDVKAKSGNLVNNLEKDTIDLTNADKYVTEVDEIEESMSNDLLEFKRQNGLLDEVEDGVEDVDALLSVNYNDGAETVEVFDDSFFEDLSSTSDESESFDDESSDAIPSENNLDEYINPKQEKVDVVMNENEPIELVELVDVADVIENTIVKKFKPLEIDKLNISSMLLTKCKVRLIPALVDGIDEILTDSNIPSDVSPAIRNSVVASLNNDRKSIAIKMANQVVRSMNNYLLDLDITNSDTDIYDSYKSNVEDVLKEIKQSAQDKLIAEQEELKANFDNEYEKWWEKVNSDPKKYFESMKENEMKEKEDAVRNAIKEEATAQATSLNNEFAKIVSKKIVSKLSDDAENIIDKFQFQLEMAGKSILDNVDKERNNEKISAMLESQQEFFKTISTNQKRSSDEVAAAMKVVQEIQTASVVPVQESEYEESFVDNIPRYIDESTVSETVIEFPGNEDVVEEEYIEEDPLVVETPSEDYVYEEEEEEDEEDDFDDVPSIGEIPSDLNEEDDFSDLEEEFEDDFEDDPEEIEVEIEEEIDNKKDKKSKKAKKGKKKRLFS